MENLLKLLRLIAASFTVCCSHFCQAQVVLDTGEIAIELSSIISGLPGDSGNDYADPSSTESTSWADALNNLLNSNYSLAADTFNTLDYSLIQFLDTSEVTDITYYLVKANANNHWGTYVYNPSFCRPVVIQSPHSKNDFNTGKEGIHVFHKSSCFFFMMNGTHRCNNSGFSSCSGTSSVCTGSSESYRISDCAHSVSTIFQQTTDTLFNSYTGTYFLQLHGFTKLMSDPYVILSNGTVDTPSVDYIPTFATKLDDEDTSLTFKIAHIDLSWTRLRGFTNTQGRLINSSTQFCTSDATATSGRFIHMEQEKTKLRDNSTGWDKVANALTNTFSCGALPVHFLNFSAERLEEDVLIKWATSSEINNDFFVVERSTNTVDWRGVDRVEAIGNSSIISEYSALDKAVGNGTYYYRIRQVDYDGTFSFSAMVHIAPYKIQRLYPNPTSGEALLSVDAYQSQHLRISNSMGILVENRINIEEVGTSLIRLNFSSLGAGIYYVRYGASVFKLVKY